MGGLVIWMIQFALAFALVGRVRRRAQTAQLTPSSSLFVSSVTACLAASMVAFLVGGSFVSLAINDLTWLTFAALAAVDRMMPALEAEGRGHADISPTVAARAVPAWRPPAQAARRGAGLQVQ